LSTTVVNAAGSSSAEPQPNFDPATFTTEQHSEWMNTGKLPMLDPAAEVAEKPLAGAAKADEPAPESAPGFQQEHKGKGADTRKAELNREIQDLLARRAELRAEVTPKTDVKAAPSPAAVAEAPKEPEAPVFGEKPDETWDQFEKRQHQYVKDLARFEAGQLLKADREQAAQTAKQAETAAAEAAVKETWSKRVGEAQTKHADYAEVAFSESTPIPGVVHLFLMNSPLGAEVLYRLGENESAEGKRIAALPPGEAVVALAEIAAGLKVADPKPKSAPVVPITKAARPGVDLKATQGATVDPTRDAIERNDVTAFFEARNAQTIAKRKQR
jgi:hypothetical protein